MPNASVLLSREMHPILIDDRFAGTDETGIRMTIETVDRHRLLETYLRLGGKQLQQTADLLGRYEARLGWPTAHPDAVRA